MKLIHSSVLAAVCAIPSAHAKLRGGSKTTLNNNNDNAVASEVAVNTIAVNDEAAQQQQQQQRKLAWDSNNNWYWKYEGWTYTTSGSYEQRYCYEVQTDNYVPLWDTALECCADNFADQTSGMCISKFDPNRQPSAAPSITGGGLAGQYTAVHGNGYEVGYCSNLKADLVGKTSAVIYDTEYECCEANFPGEPYCLAQIADSATYSAPSAHPTLNGELGLPGKYVVVAGNSYEDGYCSNLKADVEGTPDARVYDSEFECCEDNYPNQASGMCISKLPPNLQPSAAPSIAMLGLPEQYAAIYASGPEDGYCSNLKADLKNVPDARLYETEYECCEAEFPGQPYCVSQIHPNDPNYHHPSAQPTLDTELGLPEQYVAVFANGYEGGYCSNLKADVEGSPDAQVFESEFECCEKNFADQESLTCVSKLPPGLQPSAAPSIALGGLPGKYAAIYANGPEDGYCSNLKADLANVPDARLYDTEYECCAAEFPGQAYCIAQISDATPNWSRPSAQPTLDTELGLPEQYVAVFTNGFDGGYCSNLKADVEGTPDAQVYESEFECCEKNFPDQESGMCISKLPAGLQPSAAPSIALGGLPGKYAAIYANGPENGYCSNLKADLANVPDARLYDTEYECCAAEFTGQAYCIAQISDATPNWSRPSAQPTLSTELGLPEQYVAVFTNGFDGGYCSNLKADVEGTPDAQVYESEFECCESNFPDQESGMCVSKLPAGLQPSAAPSITGGGLPGKYAAIYANGHEDGYCSNLKADLTTVPDARLYDTEYECCAAEFPGQPNCIAQVAESSTWSQPSAQPTLSTELGLPEKYVAVFTNGYDGGYCSNLKADVEGSPDAQVYESEFECCEKNFPDQESGMCISKLPAGLQPSAAPSIALGGLPGKYAAIYANGHEDGYCSNLKADLANVPDARLYDTEYECCEAEFPGQANCIAQIDDATPNWSRPSAQPTLSTELGLPEKYVAVFGNDYEDGYCSNLKADVEGTPDAQVYESEFECCESNFADQKSGMCVSKLPPNLQPSAAPSITGGGLPGKYAAIYANGHEDGYCSNLKADLANVPDARLYDTEYECCAAEFPGQPNCIAQVAESATWSQPSAQPTLSTELGLPEKFVAVYGNGYEDGYCSNLKADVEGTPDAQVYESEFECCESNFADQTSGTCVSNLPAGLQPSGVPTADNNGEGGLDVWVPVWTNSYHDGYCSNKKADVYNSWGEPFDDAIECCNKWFGLQKPQTCISSVIAALGSSYSFPSAQPTLSTELGLPGKYVAIYANGYEDGYCSNLKADVEGTPDAQVFDSEFECCDRNFPDQTSGMCVSKLPPNLQPSAAPSIALGGLPGQYAAIYANGHEDGYCSNLKADLKNVPDARLYDTEYECCAAEFPGQAYCIAEISDATPNWSRPSAQPTLSTELGLPEQYVAVFGNGYEDGYCSNLKTDVEGTPDQRIYESEFECCESNFADQKTGTCVSNLPAGLQPSGVPTADNNGEGGLDVWVPVWTNSYHDGYCSNKKADVYNSWGEPFDDAIECCNKWFGLQKPQTCISSVIAALGSSYSFPSAQPTLGVASGLGLPGKYVAVFGNGYEDGYCSNLKADVEGIPDAQVYDSELECCIGNFVDQASGMCVSKLPAAIQPSAAPTISLLEGLPGQYAAIYANGYENGYCSNLKADLKNVPDARLYDTEYECCAAEFPRQEYCLSQISILDTTYSHPSAAPTVTGGGLPNAKFFPRFAGTGTPPATDSYCDNDHRSLPFWQSENYDTMGFDTQDECCEAWFPEKGNDCKRRQPTFGTLAPSPVTCGYYPKHGLTWEVGTCLNDCNHPYQYENMSNLLYTNDKAGGMECCMTWFENNGLTPEQVGSGRLSYCLEQLALANPSYGISAPPTRAPV